MTAGMSRRSFVVTAAAAPLAWRWGVRQRQEHAVVVGAGAFGGWTALALLRGGLRVTLIDAWGAGHSRASSGGETRVIRGAYGGVAIYSEMAARAMALWREAEQRWKHQLYFRTGAVWMFAGDDSYVRRSIEPMKVAGLPMEQLSLADAARRYPQMGFEGVHTVFLEPEAGYIPARAACELVREEFVREGGEYRTAWVRPGATTGSRLTTLALSDGSTLATEHAVFACGPWMAEVFPHVIGRRIIATRQEVFFFATPPGNRQYDFGALPVWVHLGERLVYGIPAHDRRGLKVADDTAGDEVNPTTMERVPTAAGLARARTILRERFPALANAPLVEARVCQYEASSDGHFLVDRHPELENVWLVGGGSGHGFKMGPALGEHVAALVQGETRVHSMFAYGRLRPRPGTRSR